MSFIDTPDNYQYVWYMRPVMAIFRWRFTTIPTPVILWARLPLAFLGFQLMNLSLERTSSPLNPALRSLIRTHIAKLNHCHFCIDLNATCALDRGITEQQLQELSNFRDSSHFSENEKIALRYAEAISCMGKTVEIELIEKLRQVYGDDGVVELAAVIAHQNLSAKFNAALGVSAAGFCLSTHKILPPD